MKAHKSILLITAAFAPDISPRSFRATELAIEFCNLGHNVDVLTLHENSFQNTIDGLTLIKNLKWKRSNRISILDRLKFYRIVEYFLDYPDISLMWEVKRELKHIRDKYDVIVSIAYPYSIHWGTALGLSSFSQRFKVTWIADCGDPYMGARLNQIRRPFYFALFEHFFCKRVDHLTVPTEGAILGYYSKYRSKISVIPQGFRMDFVPGVYVPNPVPTFAYAGSLSSGGPRNPFPFIRALQEVESDFRFHLYGQSAENFALIVNDERVIGHPSLSRQDLLKELSAMDFLVNFDNGSQRQSPSKLIDYTIAKRPIYNVKVYEIKMNELSAFLNRDYRYAFELPNFSDYDIRIVAKKFIKLVNSVLL